MARIGFFRDVTYADDAEGNEVATLSDTLYVRIALPQWSLPWINRVYAHWPKLRIFYG